MHIEGNLVIRWHEPDAFELRFVPSNPRDIATTRLRLPDADTLERLLNRLGLPRDRVVDVLASPYVLHSLRVRVDARAARRAGLIETPLRRFVAVVARWLGRPAP
jgi:hypothetical protein